MVTMSPTAMSIQGNLVRNLTLQTKNQIILIYKAHLKIGKKITDYQLLYRT